MDVFRWLFACHHRRVSRVMTIHGQTFQLCLSCGERLPYSWETMSRVSGRKGTKRDLVPTYAEAKAQWGGSVYGGNRVHLD